MDPKYDPDSPEYVRKSRSGEEIQQSMSKGYKPGMDAVSQADREMKKQVYDAEAPTMRRNINIPGVPNPVTDRPYLRHGYQSSGCRTQ